jgi:YVTN family beta-propeller protein
MTEHRRRPAVAVVATVIFGIAAALASPSAAALASPANPGRLGTPGSEHVSARAAFGPNLILNPGAQAGAFAAGGWDAVTIPGWQVTAGLPTVARYGTTHFPGVTGRQPAVRGGQLFAGGAGGTARLQQVLSLRSASGRIEPAGTRFRLGAWLGGTHRSAAGLLVTFLSAAGRVLGRAAVGPAGGPGPVARLTRRAVTGVLPPGSATARITLALTTTITNDDGPDAPLVGYNRAVADDLLLSVSAQVRRPVLTAPAAHIPRYQHVFLFYFENEDFNAVIGNTRQAPFLNRLAGQGSLLASFFAEEHPSDANYLALAGGSAFGVPLDDPLEENPQYTIRARNISDLIGAAHETWKAYLQSADGPCDDTVHGYYWDDDMPMTYFADVRDRPGFCAAHLVPLPALSADLAHADTTPNFAWVSPDDCADMEGCGIKAGDAFLATEMRAIMRSPAWRTQRSLAIITFDEDGYDYEHPAQRVATIIVGSRGVRRGYVSRVRYTHYSLLRTIEAALGLGSLTANDRYAQPVNDVFGHGQAPAAGITVATAQARPAGSVRATRSGAARSGATRPRATSSEAARSDQARSGQARPSANSASAGRPAHPTAFVVNSASNSVTPVDLVSRRAGKPIPVGTDPVAIAVAPSGTMAYAVNSGSGTVTPIATATGRTGAPIRVGTDPQAIAIAPGGQTAYVTNMGSDSVTPIDLASGRPGSPIPTGAMPRAIAITPEGRTALVLNWGGSSVTPIRLAGGRFRPGPAAPFGRPGRAIPVGGYPFAITIARGGATAYVASFGADTVTPVSLVTLRAGRPVAVGQAPDAVAVTPDGSTVCAVNGDSDSVTSFTAARPVRPPSAGTVRTVAVGYSPAAVAIPAPGTTAFVVNTISGTLTPVSVATGKRGRPIVIGTYSYPTAIELAPSGSTAVVVSPYAGQVTLVNTATRRAIATVTVGNFPVTAAIAP